jgi:hypothetical protein
VAAMDLRGQADESITPPAPAGEAFELR